MNKTPHTLIKILLLILAAILLVGIAPFIGMKYISLSRLISDPFDSRIFLMIRFPRVMTGFVAGAGLALCGMVFQAMLRNPLATPFTLGISSGASFGAAVVVLTGLSSILPGLPATAMGAFAGAVLAMIMVFGFASLKRETSNLTMLLAGIAVSFMFSSLLMFAQYISNVQNSFQIVRWLMGGLEVFGWRGLELMAPPVVLGMGVIAWKLPELNHLLTGDDLARMRGVNVGRARTVMFVATSLIVSSIVAVCGPIGFVGMMVPHMCRMIFGHDHRLLGAVVVVAGGLFLVICDTIARTVIAPAEIPVGVITALLGGPFFLWVLFRRSTKSNEEIW